MTYFQQEAEQETDRNRQAAIAILELLTSHIAVLTHYQAPYLRLTYVCKQIEAEQLAAKLTCSPSPVCLSQH